MPDTANSGRTADSLRLADAPTRDADGAPVWHALSPAQVCETLATTASGLTSTEAARRLRDYGRNVLPAARAPHPLWRFLAQFNNALIYFLLAAAGAAWLLGHQVDAFVILAVVTINAAVGFVQEGRAEKALNAIRQLVSPRAAVLRDGQRASVRVEMLVPGDIVLLEAGDRVPADLRLLRARALRIDEAILTGESVVAEKREQPVAAAASVGDRACMAFSGTLAVAGQGAGVVVATGARTEIGHIGTLIEGVEVLSTPLLQQIDRFGRRFTWTALTAAALLFMFAVFVRDFAWSEALIAVVALAVGAIPEGLPAVITITLAIGVQRMAARKAVIRRLPAVETLGATSVICSDKTGTLTRNEMTARRIVVDTHTILVSGSGYVPQGELTAQGRDDDLASVAAAAPLLRAALLCNDAHVQLKDGQWSIGGDPMEAALLVLAMKAGINPEHERAEWPRLDEIPFDAQHRYMASLHRGPNSAAVFVKGAPERVLAMCAEQAGATGAQPLVEQYWSARIAAAAAEGERVLAFAMKPAAGDRVQLSPMDVREGLLFLGLVGFIDPPRADAAAAIAECRAARIDVKMITGDHAATAAAIARQLGLAAAPTVVTGADLDALADTDLVEVARKTQVFARTSPEHKLRIVRALQSAGAVVAMTGDGVNDAPALKQADVGVAMGQKGTEAAKEASEMVLLDENFASIVAAVHEGRTVYDNIRKVIAWTLPTNGGEVLAVIAAIAFGLTMPMTPVQILWINLITSVTLGLALAFEPPEPGVMRRPPRARDAGLLSPFMLWRVVFVSVLFMLGALGIFFYGQARGVGLEGARTLVVNLIVTFEVFYLFNVRYLHMTSFTLRGALGTPAVLIAVALVIGAQFLFTYSVFMQQLFHSQPLAAVDAVVILAAGVALMILLETEKRLLRRFRWLQEGASAP